MWEIKEGDCIESMRKMDKESVDLTVTSPPYDDLRKYVDCKWGHEKWEACFQNLHRLTKNGGVVVWIVSDATVNGSETCTSFKQALFAKQCGFRLHDTMIWAKPGFTATGSLCVRYASTFEYMFVFSKGSPKSFNPIKDRPNKNAGRKLTGTIRQRDGTTKPISGGRRIGDFGQRFNVWNMPQAASNGHPAVFPLNLATDHISSWSNRGDLIFDPFMGSGTTGEAAVRLGRRFIGCELNGEWAAYSRSRLAELKGV